MAEVEKDEIPIGICLDEGYRRAEMLAERAERIFSILQGTEEKPKGDEVWSLGCIRNKANQINEKLAVVEKILAGIEFQLVGDVPEEKPSDGR